MDIFIKISHTAKWSCRVGYLTMYKKLYTNGFRKVCSDPIIFSTVARTRPRRKFFGNLGKLNLSFPLFHFPLGLKKNACNLLEQLIWQSFNAPIILCHLGLFTALEVAEFTEDRVK